MTLPDKLTVSRILLTFVFMFFLFCNGVLAKSLAFLTFLVASFTDFLDGFIARGQNISTDFGKLMDPVADKVLILAAFLAFVQLDLVPAWMVVIIVFREITITGLRVFSLTKGKVIPADIGGKQKMVSQVVSIIVILAFLIFREAGIKVFNFWTGRTEVIYKNTIFALMLVTTCLTLISGISYLIKNREVYFNNARGH
jgi:CDP-diacylglycerol--glycerol-3-phosphate 3-phosphatidyltransferase